MDICQVIGNVWATKKEPALEGLKLMIVQTLYGDAPLQSVAADLVGAGIGERVLVVRGSSARAAVARGNVPVDSAIVGIVDEMGIGCETK